MKKIFTCMRESRARLDYLFIIFLKKMISLSLSLNINMKS